jgi:hypothetical protein
MRKSFLAFGVMGRANESLKLYIRNLVRREIVLCINFDCMLMTVNMAKMRSTEDKIKLFNTSIYAART